MKIAVPGCMSLAVDDRRWFVLRLRTAYNLSLRAGSTDLAFAALKELGYDVYLPRRRFDRFDRRLRVTAEWSEPLMPGYLFVVHPRPSQPLDDWTEVRAIDGVLGPLGGVDGPLRIPARVVESILTAEFESAYDETKAAKKYRGETSRSAMEKRFARGKSFRVKGGPFASFMAKVDSLTHHDRVKMLIDIFGQMVPVEMDPEQLEEVAPKPGKAA
jgi:transcription antitermination factor NusG